MIEEKQLDGLLAVIRFHNVSRNQDFDTDWISDLSEERIQEMVVTLYTYGYITYKKLSAAIETRRGSSHPSTMPSSTRRLM